MTKFDQQGQRASAGKPALSYIPLSALEGAARVFEMGARKYGKSNWQKGLPAMSYLDSQLRHIAKMIDEGIEAVDAESGLPHLDHAITNLIMLKWSLDHNVLINQAEWQNERSEPALEISGISYAGIPAGDSFRPAGDGEDDGDVGSSRKRTE